MKSLSATFYKLSTWFLVERFVNRNLLSLAFRSEVEL